MKPYALVLVLAACGSDAKVVDAPIVHDAKVADSSTVHDGPVDAVLVDAPQFVHAVTCPPGPAATITTTDVVFSYNPTSVTITTGGIVLFTMSNTHNVVPNATDSDPGLVVGLGESKCLQFTAAGTFNFHCGPHNFMGSVVVQ